MFDITESKESGKRVEKWPQDQPPSICTRSSYETFTPAELEAHQTLVDTGRVNVYQNPSRKKRAIGFVIGASIVAVPLFTFLPPASLFYTAAYTLLAAVGGRIGYSLGNRNVSVNHPHTVFYNRHPVNALTGIQVDSIQQPLLQYQR